MRSLHFITALFLSSGYFVDTAVEQVFSGVVQHPTSEQINSIELITNGNFLQDISFWEINGEVEYSQNCATNTSCVSLGAQESEEIALLIQELQVPNLQPASLSFKIQTQTVETLLGFDSPYFSVLIDEMLIYEEHFSPALPLSQWRDVIIPIPKLEPGSHTIKFKQQNTGDNQFATIVFITAISTKTQNLNLFDSSPPARPAIHKLKKEGDGQLTLHVSKPTDTYGYEIQCLDELSRKLFSTELFPANTFGETAIVTTSIPEDENCQEIQLKVFDAVGNYSSPETVLLVF